MRPRLLATSLVVAVGALVAALGVTWAADTTTPRLERTSSATLFDGVHLSPGQPVVRCAALTPRGAALTALGFAGSANGALAPAVTLRVERGGGPSSGVGCDGFVPERTVYDGRLDRLPADSSALAEPVRIARDRPVRYRATLALAEPAAGATAFGLQVTGAFADDVGPPPPAQPVPPPAQPLRQCLHPRSGHRVQRTDRAGAVRLVVRTPRSLPVTLVQPLAVYAETAGTGDRPRMRVGDRRISVRRTPGGRWVGRVPLDALGDAQRVDVAVGPTAVRIPVPSRPCAVRVRAFLRAGRTVDLRIDSRHAIVGTRLRLPSILGRPRAGTVTVRALDDDGDVRVSRGALSRDGRDADDRLPRVRIDGRSVELLDVPHRVGAVSVRMRVSGTERARHSVCRGRHVTPGYLSTLGDEPGTRRHRIRTPLAIIGDRCPRGPDGA
jgi:hypothetical protein